MHDPHHDASGHGYNDPRPGADPLAARQMPPAGPPTEPWPFGGHPAGPWTDPHRSPPDAGSPTSRKIALVLAVVAATLAIVWQNLPEPVQHRLIGYTPPPPPPRAQVVEDFSQFSIMGRMHTKLASVTSADPTQAPQIITQLDSSAFTEGERIASAIVIAEVVGTEPALERLDGLDHELRDRLTDDGWAAAPGLAPPIQEGEQEGKHEMTPEQANALHDLRQDIEDLRYLYTEGAGALTDAEGDRLATRYGYFGRVARTFGLEDEPGAARHDEAKDLRSGGFTMMGLLLTFGAVVVVALLAGLVLLAIGAIKLGSGRWKPMFKPPAPGGSVSLEVYGLFVLGFLLLVLGTLAVQAYAPKFRQVFVVYLLVQWSLILIPLVWPKLRGSGVKGPLGLFATRGVVREMGWGLLIYIASVPLFALGVVITMGLMILKEFIFPTTEPPSNPIFEMVANADPVSLVLLATLVTIWAPLCEEMIFRGALYRALRTRVGFFVAALVSALLFAAMHSYGPLMLTPLVVLGFMFAFMREMRGSIIPSITAHCIHNTFVLGVVVMMMVLLSD